MKFIINREQLLLPLQQIVNVIEKRQTIPILSNVLITIGKDYLVLTGTDLEIQIIVRIIIENSDEGTLTIPARKLLDICRLLPQQASITIEQAKDKVKVSSGRSRFSLSSLPAETYPEFIETEFTNQFTINAGKLKNALEKTVFCMANQDVRFFLNGLLLNISNQKLKLVASDGHRLAIYEDQLEQPSALDVKIVLPRKGVIELSRLLDDPNIELNIEFSANNIRVYIKNIVFSAKLVDAKYPDYTKVFNQTFLSSLFFQRQILKDTLTRVAILSNEKIKGVMLDISSDSMKVSAHNPEHEIAEEEISVGFNEDPISIAFNVQYLLDAVSNLDSDGVMVRIAANSSSCVIEDPKSPLYQYIVMSMRL